MRILLYILIIFISLNSTFSFEYNFKTFKLKGEKSLVELNYTIHSALDSLNNYDEIKFSISFNSTGITEVEDEWLFTYDSKSSDSAVSLFDKRFYSLYPGQYEYKIEMNYSKGEFNQRGKLNIPDYNTSNLKFSDIIVADSISLFKPEIQDEKYNKGGYFIIPNIQQLFRNNINTVKLYVEIYNAKNYINDNLKFKYYIKNGVNDNIVFFSKTKKIQADNFLEVASIPIDTLYNGSYTAVIESYNNNDKLLDVASTKFYVYIPDNQFQKQKNFIEDISFERSPFAIMPMPKIEEEFEKIQYILSEYEIGQYENLSTLRAKQRAVYGFWKSRDTDTSTAVNEYLFEYQQRIDYANTYFSKGSSMKGWKTPRGRILLKYGFPTNRERYNAEEGKNAAEEWFYSDLYGGTYFFFVDRYGARTFQLVHSTASNEITNYNWFQEFNPAIENDGSPRYNSNRINPER